MVPHQLPLPPPTLLGRTAATERLTDAIARDDSTVTVLVIEGPGGMGKSALALHWAHQQRHQFPDGQLYVDLGGFDQLHTPAAPLSVLQEFLSVFGVPPDAIPADEPAAASLYRGVLAGKRVLVLLDNAADTAQVTPLLPASPSCVVLVTSRNTLTGLRRHSANALRLDILSPDDAHALLVHHLSTAQAIVEPAAVDLMLDCSAGLPLALVLVAARVRNQPELPMSVIVDELHDVEHRLDVFDVGDGSANLRTVLSWSYRGLRIDEAAGFRLLGAAPAHEFGIPAAASLLALNTLKTSVLLRSLESKNLVQQHRARRYRMHDLVRLYSRKLAAELDNTAEVTTATRRLVDFYLHTAHHGDQLFYPHRSHTEPPAPVAGSVPLRFSAEPAALTWFADEQPQLLAALRAAIDHGWLAQGWQLSRALDTYQYRRGRIHDNVTTSRLGAVAADRIRSPVMQALALRQLGRAYTRTGDHHQAVRCLNRALALARDNSGLIERAHTHHDLSRVLALLGEHDRSMRHSVQALELYRAGGNPVGEAHALNAIARLYALRGDHDHARHYARSALTLHERHDNASGAAVALDNLGLIAHLAGQSEDAERWYTRALELSRRQDNAYFEAEVTEHLADALRATGRLDEATRTLHEAHRLYVAQHRLADAERVRQRLHTTQG